MSHQFKVLLTIITLALITVLSSCSTLSYYGQSISGQLQLLRAQQKLKTVLQSTETSAELRRRLESIVKIRDFASDVIKLPQNNSYRSYADIGRKYIVWNVFATPALSLQPHQSCFLIIGCLSYRGYFKKKDALVYMKTLKTRGFDTYLGGVTAYSTLGWFDDPILSGMLDRNNFELARLIFHELAHQKIYIKDDTEFNEAFADDVALIGLDYWLRANGSFVQRNDFEQQLTRENQFIELVLSYRDKLNRLYQSRQSDEQKQWRKKVIFEEMQTAYSLLRANWGEYNEYDDWFKHGLNNAKLAAISTYRNLVPQFIDAYRTAGGDFDAFFSRVTDIGKCEQNQRRQLLRSRSPVVAC